MGRPANAEKNMVENANVEVKKSEPVVRTIEECRKRAKINIMLPPSHNEGANDMYEFVTVNGTTTQIRRGEKVAVNWLVFEALTNPETGRYSRSILV